MRIGEAIDDPVAFNTPWAFRSPAWRAQLGPRENIGQQIADTKGGRRFREDEVRQPVHVQSFPARLVAPARVWARLTH
jgi:hypothetical protein